VIAALLTLLYHLAGLPAVVTNQSRLEKVCLWVPFLCDRNSCMKESDFWVTEILAWKSPICVADRQNLWVWQVWFFTLYMAPNAPSPILFLGWKFLVAVFSSSYSMTQLICCWCRSKRSVEHDADNY
jgi:hypothetical protein